MSKSITAFGVNYTLPTAHLLHATPLFISEFGARTCYNSFDKSESKSIQDLNTTLNNQEELTELLPIITNEVNNNGSELLHQLSHVYFHESTLEHTTLNFVIKNTSRAVLQELARHRIASFSVQSTRYTLSDLINWFITTKILKLDIKFFINQIDNLNIFISDDRNFNAIEIGGIYNKLEYQWKTLGELKFLELSVAKSILAEVKEFEGESLKLFNLLSSKAKKNVGDFIKMSAVTESMSVDLAFTINLRSLKNFIDLRLSGAAFYQMRWLAHTIYKQIPENYLKLIVKDSGRNQFDKLDTKILSGVWS